MRKVYITLLYIGLVLGVYAFPLRNVPAPQQESINLTTQPVVHDPVLIKQGETYYLFSTGEGVSIFTSSDMKHWKYTGRVFETPPEWARQLIKGYEGHTWAPDIIYYGGLYHLFYSCSTFGRNNSAIGHATTPTLDQNDPVYGWTDHGMVVHSIPGRDMWNAIDPNIIIDEKGNPWMTFGSFWDGIKLVRMTKDLMGISEPEEWHTIASRSRNEGNIDSDPGNGAIEAPFIIRHGDFYYLFASFDYCCRGEKSDYKVRVGRSKAVAGPYVDKEGKLMTQGGGTLVVEGNKSWHGVGHNGIYTDQSGVDYFVCHGYAAADGGTPHLIIKRIAWTSDGWPHIEL